MDKKEFVLKAIADKRALIVDVSDKIFGYAEVGFHEFRTAKLYEEVLKKEGFQVEMGVGGMPTAFKAVYGSGKPVIGFLAEYDALPELSQEGGCTMRKKAAGDNPDGHGCGHNLLGAGAMAAALAVKAYIEEHPEAGTVILFGCPSEEKGDGKAIMAREGVFDGVDAAFTWHPGDKNAIWSESTLANVSVFFNFKGVTSHAAAAPELGRSALDAAELMSVGVNYLREHIISDARVHYAYRDVGGIAPNVVQGHSRVHYFIRAPKSWQVKEIYKRVVDVALASKFFHETATPDEMEAKRANMRRMFGANHIEEIEAHPLHTGIAPLVWNGKVQAGSTDVGDASYVIPTAMCTTATATLGTAAHTWQMTAHGNTGIAHKAMLNAGEAMALAALKTMESPEILKKAHDEWMAETNGEYDCPIPKEVGPRLED